MSDPTVKRAFISYVMEDRPLAIKLQGALEAAGINVWLDKEELWPGQDWKTEIRKAIRSDSVGFLACFSEQSLARQKSYQNEELILAVEEYRLRPPGAQWLFPVRFAEVAPPDFDLGAGRTFSDLHFSDLFGESDQENLVRLIVTLNRLLAPEVSAATIAAKAAAADLPGGGPQTIARIKALLRDPNGDIALEEEVLAVVREVRDALEDQERFPVSVPHKEVSNLDWTIRVRDTLADYRRAVEPLVQVLTLAGLYGKPEHEHVWRMAMDALGHDARQELGLWGGNGVGGTYAYRYIHGGASPETQFAEALERAGAGWSPLLGGLFGGDPERATKALSWLSEAAASLRQSRW